MCVYTLRGSYYTSSNKKGELLVLVFLITEQDCLQFIVIKFNARNYFSDIMSAIRIDVFLKIFYGKYYF